MVKAKKNKKVSKKSNSKHNNNNIHEHYFKHHGLYIFGIVACVAIVALVLMLKGSSGSTEYVISSDDALAGQAGNIGLRNAQPCGNNMGEASCSDQRFCQWLDWCEDTENVNCWVYYNESSCISDPSCVWYNDEWGSYCSEIECWDYYDESSCNSMNGCGWTGMCRSTADCENIFFGKICLMRGCTWDGSACTY
jgi:hypothetical protein